MLEQTKIESTVRYLGIEVDDALAILPWNMRPRKAWQVSSSQRVKRRSGPPLRLKPILPLEYETLADGRYGVINGPADLEIRLSFYPPG